MGLPRQNTSQSGIARVDGNAARVAGASSERVRVASEFQFRNGIPKKEGKSLDDSGDGVSGAKNLTYQQGQNSWNYEVQ
jgi:hypothetical protein